MTTHTTTEEQLVHTAMRFAKTCIVRHAHNQVAFAWSKHKHQLFCALCEFSPDGSEENEYWGECSSRFTSEGSNTIVLCPQCLHSPWTLYKQHDMKIAAPRFNPELSFTEMMWKLEGPETVPYFVTTEIGLHKNPHLICPTALLHKLHATGFTGITNTQIDTYLKRPISVYPAALLVDNGFFKWRTLNCKNSEIGSYRFRVSVPTELKWLSTFFMEEYETDHDSLFSEVFHDIKPFTHDEAVKHGWLNWDFH